MSRPTDPGTRSSRRQRAPAAVAREIAAASPEDRLRLLRSGLAGLDAEEAALRLRDAGPNEPAAPARQRPLLRLLANFTHTLALLLWFAAGLAFGAGVPELGIAIVAVVIVNGIFAFVQEHRAERVVDSLLREVAVQALVLRDGREQRIPAVDLVPGDIVRLAAGDIVPADCAFVSADNVSLDMSMLTGETLPVDRATTVTSCPLARATLLDLPSLAPAGAAVVTGSGMAVVWATGPQSTVGQVAALVEGVHRAPSLLERQIGEVSRITAVIAVLAGTATLSLAAVFTETSTLAALTFATGVIVALVPEGLLPTLNVSLAIGAARMAGRGAAVRRLSSVEIIGSVTVICTDKTGTLTENAIAVLGFVGPDGAAEPSRASLLAAALCNDARKSDSGYEGDPIDVALARWSEMHGIEPTAARDGHRRLADTPFDAHRRFMTVTCEVDGGPVDFVKGAPEAVLALAGVPAAPAIEAALKEASGRGERVLLLASAPAGSPPAVVGLIRLHDPPRAEVPAAIAACARAGIRVMMLTGDHPATAQAVARFVGLGDATIPVIDGATLETMPDAELAGVMRQNAVFARIDPAQKLRIVTLLQREGEVVVVTGDGVNDAPALRAADVGVAMGRRGTEVAKQAADLVLSDDNFATIVAAIEEGRSIKTNIRRFVSYVFTSNVAELAPFLLYIFLPVPLPLAIMQVLAIDLGTDLLPALALGAEPPAARVLDEPPEPPRTPLLTRPLFLTTFLFFGLIEAGLGLIAFFGAYSLEGWRPFQSLDPFSAIQHEAMTATFLGIVAGQIGCLVAERDGRLRDRLSFWSNRWMLWGLIVELLLAVVLIYVPGLNRAFSMTAVSPAWLLVLPCGAALFIALDEVRRGLRRLRR